MFINPKEAIQKGWIKGVLDEAKQVQPNAIDFTLDELNLVDDTQTAVIGESKKKMRPLTGVQATDTGYWELDGGKVYDGTSKVYVEVPEGYAAILYTRSTFARNGVFIVSGLYDSGYKGHVGFTIYTLGGPVKIEEGVRIGQIALIKSESAGVYAGGYNHQAGTHYTEQPKITGRPATQVGQQNQAPAPSQAEALATTLSGSDVGQKQIPGDPRRTETGMGPLLAQNSKYI